MLTNNYPQTFQIAGRHVRGNMTLGEDIADCGGLHSSYLAMNKYMSEVEKRPASLFEKKMFSFRRYSLCYPEFKVKKVFFDRIRS